MAVAERSQGCVGIPPVPLTPVLARPRNRPAPTGPTTGPAAPNSDAINLEDADRQFKRMRQRLRAELLQATESGEERKAPKVSFT